jgi:hypothetical protein
VKGAVIHDEPSGGTGAARTGREHARVRARIADEPGPQPKGVGGWLQRLCRVAARDITECGVAVSLRGERGPLGIAASSDTRARANEELQETLGEGPSVEAFATRRPVLVHALDGDGGARWPGFAAAALEAGVRGVFAFPLQFGAARFGVLDVLRDRPGALSSEHLGYCLTLAEVATATLLDGQERSGAGVPPAGLDAALESSSTIHQAQGMVMVQLGVSLADALSRLRAHAFAQNRHLSAVAADVVARRLILERDSL